MLNTKLTASLALPLFTFAIALPSPFSYTARQSGDNDCKCIPEDACWPKGQEWAQFNRTLGGKLIATLAPGAVCHDPTFSSDACAEAQSALYYNSYWRAAQPGAMQYTGWEAFDDPAFCSVNTTRDSRCPQGDVSVYTVATVSAEDVAEAIKFAKAANLKVAVKSTGHDHQGRSAAKGSLTIWTQPMKNMTFSEAYSRAGDCPRTLEAIPAVSVAPGISWAEAYAFTNDHGYVPVGGGGTSVSAAGGYVGGGGHSPLGPQFGMSADNVLEMEVVTADGEIKIANDCLNQDLFLALRGGGGGTYGVVTRVTHRLYRSAPLLFGFFNANFTSDSSLTQSIIRRANRAVFPLTESGWSGYARLYHPKGLYYALINPSLNASFSPLSDLASSLPQGVAIATTIPYPSFNAWFADTIGKNNETSGTPTTLGSRLLPPSVFASETEVDKLADALWEARDFAPIVHFVAGGEVARKEEGWSAVNPAWRKALAQVVISSGWEEGAAKEEQRKAFEEISSLTDRFRELAPDSGAYTNEADYLEPDWQQSFFGAHYPRLAEIKKAVDPDGLFWCHHCVGSEEWDEEGTCRV